MSVTVWLDTHIDELRAALKDGCSFSEAAARVNGMFGTAYSRNAAIGKASRDGIVVEKKDKPEPRPRARNKHIHIVPANGNSNKQRIIETNEPEQAAPRCVDIEPRNIALLDLEAGDCRYPYGEDIIVFCGHPKFNGGSYCLPHLRLSTANRCTNSEAVTDARARRMRGINFRRALLEGTA